MFSVSQKILIARQLNRLLRLGRRACGRDMHARCRRRGLNWALDLDEGIDLSIYLLGAYEPRTLRAYEPLVAPGAVVFDIGANIGAHTLHFARLVGPAGRVVAFEPTDFACAKLRANLALNPALAGRVDVRQLFLVADRSVPAPAAVAASWPVADTTGALNAWHGRDQRSDAARAMTADDFCAENGVQRIDLVKLDVDGHEGAVLQGFRASLARFRPVIIVELAPFIYSGAKAAEFDEFVTYLAGLGYYFTDANSGRAVPAEPAALRRHITPGGGINAVLRPR
ncbi:MAG TPA: FkbM family methyltransferase [Lacunisphaera sp.]|nr:FkbM family methyltransferase [Lacunisphaera sp.]